MKKEQPVNVTRARLVHLDTLAVLFDAYRSFYGQSSDLALAEMFLAERLRNGDSVVFLAHDPATGEGLGFVQLFASFSSVSAQALWILNDLFVATSARGAGIGRALMERARDHAVETHAKGLLLSTQIDNKIAQSLYEDLGYQRDVGFYNYFLAV